MTQLTAGLNKLAYEFCKLFLTVLASQGIRMRVVTVKRGPEELWIILAKVSGNSISQPEYDRMANLFPGAKLSSLPDNTQVKLTVPVEEAAQLVESARVVMQELSSWPRPA